MWIRTSTRNISHRHTNTPFRYLLWSKLSHLVRGQTFEQEASKQSSKNSLTQWYIVVFGGRYSNGAWDPHQCPFCHTRYTFHLKSESWDARCASVPDVEQDAWLFLVDMIKHYTYSCYVPAKTLWNLHIFHTDFLLLFQDYKNPCMPPLRVQYL